MGQIQPPSDKNRAQNPQKSSGKDKSLEDKDTTRMETKPQSSAGQKPQQNMQKQDTMRQSAASDDDMEDIDIDEEMMEASEGEGQNEGEGSRSAARAYNQGLQRNMAKGQTEQQAKEAEDALQGPEGEELRRAEQVGKRGQPSKPH